VLIGKTLTKRGVPAVLGAVKWVLSGKEFEYHCNRAFSLTFFVFFVFIFNPFDCFLCIFHYTKYANMIDWLVSIQYVK